MKHRNVALKYGSDGEYLDRLEAARLLGLSPATLDRWRCEKAHLPYYKIGGAIRYRRSELEEFLASHRVNIGQNGL